jgi:hypothetical protein
MTNARQRTGPKPHQVMRRKTKAARLVASSFFAALGNHHTDSMATPASSTQNPVNAVTTKPCSILSIGKPPPNGSTMVPLRGGCP